ncbi:MAG: DUF2442 domain-containing protein [bacterium]|nr:DUF2442 domain-containing protein [bacterium]
MYLSVVNVKPLEGYKLLLTFENNEEKIFDVSPYLNIGRFSELKDKFLFKTAKVKFDSIKWANSLDLDPELLYHKSKKAPNSLLHSTAGIEV